MIANGLLMLGVLAVLLIAGYVWKKDAVDAWWTRLRGTNGAQTAIADVDAIFARFGTPAPVPPWPQTYPAAAAPSIAESPPPVAAAPAEPAQPEAAAPAADGGGTVEDALATIDDQIAALQARRKRIEDAHRSLLDALK